MSVGTLNTLEKGIAILDLLAEVGAPLGVAEIAERMGLPLSTAYRYVATLKQHQLLEQDPVAGSYRLGTRLLDWSGAVARPGVRQVSLPRMVSLSRRCGETVILSALRQHEGICLEKVEGHHALRVSHELGAVFPLHAGTSGKTLLAYVDPEDQKEILQSVGLERFTETTITDPELLRGELRRISAQGYAESDGEVLRGTYGIGAPIFSEAGRIIAALSVSAPRHRLEGERRKKTIEWVVNTAQEITGDISKYRPG
ncbi:MAG: IclR family transcriptional regulator [Candidatus Bipolaricaulota bacterium]|nr:MAG: IclR family transcriptional regulator [Candidatus Bipolaricaulota bacterium]